MAEQPIERRGTAAGEGRDGPLAARRLRDERQRCRRPSPTSTSTTSGWTTTRTTPSASQAVTRGQALAAAKKYLDADKLIVVAVGDRAKIAPALGRLNLGLMEVWTGR